MEKPKTINEFMENTSAAPKPAEGKWSKPQIGGLYNRTSKTTGKNYLAGYIEIEETTGLKRKHKIVIFPSRTKEKENHFDFCVYKDEDDTKSK